MHIRLVIALAHGFSLFLFCFFFFACFFSQLKGGGGSSTHWWSLSHYNQLSHLVQSLRTHPGEGGHFLKIEELLSWSLTNGEFKHLFNSFVRLVVTRYAPLDKLCLNPLSQISPSMLQFGEKLVLIYILFSTFCVRNLYINLFFV